MSILNDDTRNTSSTTTAGSSDSSGMLTGLFRDRDSAERA